MTLYLGPCGVDDRSVLIQKLSELFLWVAQATCMHLLDDHYCKFIVMGATILPVLLRLSRIPYSCRRHVLLSSYSTIPSIQESRDYDLTINRIDGTIMC